MELRHLRYLVAVAEELHFGRAARRLHISQPPLSHQIIQLEAEIGVKLFQRNKRTVRLTEEGKRIVAEANLVLGHVDHLSSVAALAGGGEIGQLSIGVPSGVNQVLIDTLKLVASKYPGVRIELQYMTTGIQIEALKEGRIQVGFLNLPLHHSDFELETVRTEPLWLAIPPEHPIGRYKQVPLAALDGEELIIFFRRVAPGLHDTITEMFKENGVRLNAAHETDNVVASLTLASAGVGIAFCTPSVRSFWPNLVFRPLKTSVRVEQAVAYRRDSKSQVLHTFLKELRHVVRRKGSPRSRL
jgi:DNA-binding transcriptional LysR family regulator